MQEQRKRPRVEVTIPDDVRRSAMHAAIDAGQTLGEWMADAAREKLTRDQPQ